MLTTIATPRSENWTQRYPEKVRTAEEAVGVVRPGHRVFVGSGAGQPQTLVEALSARDELSDTEIIHIFTLGVATYAEHRFGEKFRHNAYFIGPNVRSAISDGRADYTPIFLSEIPELFSSGRVVIDVALIEVSPPDEHGYCSYGVATDIVKSATESAHYVIAEVNDQMPRALGDCFIHVRDINEMVPTNRPLPEAILNTGSELAGRIAKHVANLVEDGATLQLGIGNIPDAVLAHLGDFNDLGVHTEMFSDSIIPLVKNGVITNAAKTLHRGKIISSFVTGTRELYDFIDNNPLVEFHPTEYTNDPFIIAQNNKMISINGAIEVDLTGQVCADSIGDRFYSGIGGQVDFTRGAARSKGGKPIIALPSTASHETVSRIVPHLKQGAGVVTSRGDVHYVVTEYGSAYLHGKSVRERAMALIEISHPKFRPWLLSEAKARRLVYLDQIELPIQTPIYPERLEKQLTLKDGSQVFMRPIKLTDEPRVRELFYKLSSESVRARFLGTTKSMPHRRLQELLRVDYGSQMVLLALTGTGDDAQAVGLAHSCLNPRTNLADVAFLVRDDWQGRGLASTLLKAVIEDAQSKSIAGLTAEVLMQNTAMIRVFNGCGYPVESKLEDGLYSLNISFAPTKRQRKKLAVRATDS
ncbi:MAG: GNAT family N-acetyltransferase [Planctomycetes bacterium]|nr:GNAT family N-acetyltransferase [Planctomycetota bacterium]